MIPTFPKAAHPMSRKPLQRSTPLSWSNYYHPASTSRLEYPQNHDHSDTRQTQSLPSQFLKAFNECDCYYELARTGLNGDEIYRIVDKDEESPELPDDELEIDRKACKNNTAKWPGDFRQPEKDDTLMPVLCIDQVLSNILEMFGRQSPFSRNHPGVSTCDTGLPGANLF